MTERTGRSGYLRLVFEGSPKTILADQAARPPFHVQRAIHHDAHLPGMAYLYMMSTSGGILGGDSHQIDISVGDGSAAHITTQGATRIYGTRSRPATQATSITLGRDSYLEFIPDQTIPYADSSYSQTTTITADQTAAMAYSEIVTSGRRAMGESFEYRSYQTRTTIQSGGELMLQDTAVLEPKRRNITAYGIMGSHTIMGTVYVLAPTSRISGLYDTVNAQVSNHPTVLGGASMARGRCCILARMLGDDTPSVTGLTRRIVGLVREHLLGATLPEDRKS